MSCRPLTDDEIAEARESLEELRGEVQKQLAEDLGGDPEDYDSTRYFQQLDEGDQSGEAVPDGGE